MKLYQLAAFLKTGNMMPQGHGPRVHEPPEDRSRPTFEAYLHRVRPERRQPVAISQNAAPSEQPVCHQHKPEFSAPVRSAPSEQPVRNQQKPDFAAPVRSALTEQPVRNQQEPEFPAPVVSEPIKRPEPQQDMTPIVAPISTLSTEPLTLAFFEQLRDDASDRNYPLDGSKRREQHENYARMLLDRVRAARSQMGAAAAVEGSYSGQSWSAQDTTFDQIFAALDEVERFMDAQAQRVSDGENVTLIEGTQRHLLSDALGKLYFEMKDFFNA